TSTDTNTSRNTVTSSDGTYLIPSVVPGNYSLRVAATGFDASVTKGIVIQVDENRRVSPQLKVGSVNTEVSVSSSAAQVDTHTATMTQVIDSDSVKELPLNGRNPLDLQLLVPGAGLTATGSGGQSQNNVISINGGRSTSINYTLDGQDNEDPFFNTPSIVPNPDALDQYSLQTSNYGAQEGRSSGAQVNAITKSGTNAIHGTAFYYVRNQVLDAAGYFNTTGKSPYKRSQFGGTIGGPILKDRLFYFGSYQGTRLNSSPSNLTVFVPSAAELAGDFSELCPAGFTLAGVCSSTAAPNKQLTIPGTKTIAPRNNLAPYLSQISLKYAAAFIPAPNTTASNGLPAYEYAPTSYSNEDQYMGKLDYHFGTKDTLSGRFFYVKEPSLQIPNSQNLPGFQAQLNYKNYAVAVNETHAFSPRLVNLFTFGFGDIVRNQLPLVPKQLSFADFGSTLTRSGSGGPIGSDTAVAGYFQSLSRWTLNQYRHEFQYSDLINWTIGAHTLSLGGDIRQAYSSQNQNFQAEGQFKFAASYTGNALGDFLTGHLNSFRQQSFNAGAPQNVQPDAFAQDDWKISRRLTLNLGVRWEPFIPFHDALGQLARYSPGQQSTVHPQAPVGDVFPGDAGVSKDTYSARYGRVSPRIGFAYDVFGDGKTALRAGVGIYYTSLRQQSYNSESLNQPYGIAISSSKPTGGIANPYSDVGNPFPYQGNFPSPLGTLSDFDPHFQNGRVDQWTASLQQQLPWQMIFTVAYVGSAGEHQLVQVELNASVYGKPGANPQQRRVNPAFSSIQRQYPGFHSSYHALQSTLNKRITKGLQFGTAFTWAKSLDNASNDGYVLTNPFDYRFNRGLSDLDLRVNSVTSLIYRLPGSDLGGHHVLAALLSKGWEVNGIFQARTGNSFSVFSGVDNSQSGVGQDFADVVPGQVLHTNRHQSKQNEITKYFNTAAYKVNAVGTFGNSGRNSVIGPGFVNLDFGLIKAFPMHNNRFRAVVRAEAFNAFNHTNLTVPAANVSATTFGTINGQAGNPRLVQLAVRFEF
ncbi:MAG: carboxypeptidase regulatory-like domain-containing protein, partial [Bryocella sp.]